MDLKNFLLKTLKKHIISYKSWSTSSVITKPNLPLIEDERLVRIFTHLIGDGYGGGIYDKSDGTKFYILPTYTNTSPDLIKEFISDLKIFGNVPFNKRYGYSKNKQYEKVLIPLSIKYILEHIYEVELSASRGRLPKRFFTMNKSLKYQVMKAFCDDEGTVQDNGIVISSSNKKQLEDFNKLMITIGFKSKFITNVKLGIRNTYSLKFYGDNFIFYGKFIGLVHPEKMDT